MNFDVDTRSRILVDMTLDFDPTGTTVELSIDGTWYAATWQGSPVRVGTDWAQTAQTNLYFAGPDAVASGATVLASGDHDQKTRVTNGQQIIAESAGVITIG